MFLFLYSFLILNSHANYYSPSLISTFIDASEAFKKGNVIKVLDPIIDESIAINTNITQNSVKRFASDYRGLLPVPMLIHNDAMTGLEKYYILQTVIKKEKDDIVMELTFLNSEGVTVSKNSTIVSFTKLKNKNNKVKTAHDIVSQKIEKSSIISKEDIKEAVISLYSGAIIKI